MKSPPANEWKLCVDVHYSEFSATAAGVLFRSWEDSAAVHETVIRTAVPADYEPGAFYKRELPCLLALLPELPLQPRLIIIDGYVRLGPDRPGLGHHLFIALGGRIPVIGIAKSRFDSSGPEAVPVLRGAGSRPLYITAEGVPVGDAAMGLAAMHGPHRIPTLVKRADQLSRAAPPMPDSLSVDVLTAAVTARRLECPTG